MQPTLTYNEDLKKILTDLQGIFITETEAVKPKKRFDFEKQSNFLQYCKANRLIKSEQYMKLSLALQNYQEQLSNTDPLYNTQEKIDAQSVLKLEEEAFDLKSLIYLCEGHGANNKDQSLSDELSIRVSEVFKATLNAMENLHENQESDPVKKRQRVQKVFLTTLTTTQRPEPLKKPQICNVAMKKNSVAKGSSQSPSVAQQQTKSEEKLTMAASSNGELVLFYSFCDKNISDSGKVVDLNLQGNQISQRQEQSLAETQMKMFTQILTRTEEIAFEHFLKSKNLQLKDNQITDGQGKKVDLSHIRQEYLNSQTDVLARNNVTLSQACAQAIKEFNHNNPKAPCDYKFVFKIKPAPEKQIVVDSKPDNTCESAMRMQR